MPKNIISVELFFRGQRINRRRIRLVKALGPEVVNKLAAFL